MGANRTPAKPQRQRAADGHFRCYRCPQELAVASVREKCCRSCLLLLVRKAVATEMSTLRQMLSEQQELQQQQLQTAQREQQHEQQPQQTQQQQQDVADASRQQEDVPLYVAVSGGDASLSLLYLLSENIEKKLSRRRMRQQRESGLMKGPPGCKGEGAGPGNSGEPEFSACVALHVDIQRLLRPPAAIVRARFPARQVASGKDSSRSNSNSSNSSNSSNCSCCCCVQTSVRTEDYVVAEGFSSLSDAGETLPLQIQKTASSLGPHVHCMLLHPLGPAFSYMFPQQREGGKQEDIPIEVYRHPDGRLCGREDLERMQQQEAKVRRLLARTFAADKATAERICRALVYDSETLNPKH